MFDLGGGTFDVTILNLSAGIIDVEATSGDMFLGGRDMDEALVDYFL